MRASFLTGSSRSRFFLCHSTSRLLHLFSFSSLFKSRARIYSVLALFLPRSFSFASASDFTFFDQPFSTSSQSLRMEEGVGGRRSCRSFYGIQLLCGLRGIFSRAISRDLVPSATLFFRAWIFSISLGYFLCKRCVCCESRDDAFLTRVGLPSFCAHRDIENFGESL